MNSLKAVTTSQHRTNTKYSSLTPTIDPEGCKVYCDALHQVVARGDVKNIAVTGPYGSGKSTVIKTFLSQCNKPHLDVSLASFAAEKSTHDQKGHSNEVANSNNIDTKSIERSIIQQMLYREDARKFPLSRFKRIATPSRFAWLQSLALLLGSFAAWQSNIIFLDVLNSGKNWSDLAPIQWGILVTGALFLWFVTFSLYKKSFGFSIKGLSVSDIEVVPEDAEESSILNRHLDEIIYFFQTTSYELVIFEDLDRFNEPEVFVSLREMNSLINKNEGIKRKVCFIYAVRDEMFQSEDRAKFFDFIVPIIPIINYSNSVDKFRERASFHGVENRLSPQFIREVSRYLNDLRLIGNIFNELKIYASVIEQDRERLPSLDKLLALLIYKNWMPSDFAKLHYKRGVFSSVLQTYDDCVRASSARIEAQVQALSADIEQANAQLPRNLEELRRSYAMAIIQRLPENFSQIWDSQQQFPLSKLVEEEFLERVLNQRKVSVRHSGALHQVELSGLEQSVDPSSTYLERKAQIQKKLRSEREKIRGKIETLRQEAATLRLAKFHYVLRDNLNLINPILDQAEDKRNLLAYLVLEGYLDDTYNQYSSLFHRGRLSTNDYDYLISIRSFVTPPPVSPLDNPHEVVAEMRPGDFQQTFALNVNLVDYLVQSSSIEDVARIKSVIKVIAAGFEQSSEFFEMYYTHGRNVQAFVRLIATEWEGFSEACVASNQRHVHVAKLLSYCDIENLRDFHNKDGLLSKFLGENLADVASQMHGVSFEYLKGLDVKVYDLKTLQGNNELFSGVLEHDLFALNFENVCLVYEHYMQVTAPEVMKTSNLSTIIRSGNRDLQNLIDRNFLSYTYGVLIKRPENTDEEEAAILHVLNHPDIPFEAKLAFFTYQTLVFNDVNRIPRDFVLTSLEQRKITISWQNVISTFDLFETEEHRSSLVTFLQDAEVLEQLSVVKFERIDKNKQFSSFLILQYSLSLEVYEAYVRCIPFRFKNLPGEAPREYRLVLLNANLIGLNSESFANISSDSELLVLLLSQNFEEYLSNAASYSVPDETLEGLFHHEEEAGRKLRVLSLLPPDRILVSSTLCSEVALLLSEPGPIYHLPRADCITAMLNSVSKDVQKICILNRVQQSVSDDQIRDILASLPAPYADLAGYGANRVTIDHNLENLVLVGWLQRRRVISSWSKNFVGTEIRINRFRGP
ncbi:MAG: hypothetical protein O9289_07530 [Rhodobacteraceae bacterium]|nr:hypothetical protein [Paracoccaceae bacterium]MCZ8083043.1 hypothetical protein [Paracoccaceae bacterium]